MHNSPPGFEKRFQASCCRNCGQIGHIYRDCPHPITSFGIICYRMNAGGIPEFLMIQRKDSLSFMEFIRGKYELDQISYIGKLLGGMTQVERTMLVNAPFEQLWNHVWYQSTMPRHTTEFDVARSKFEALSQGYQCHGTAIRLANLVDQYGSPYIEPEWGFPKGRRRIREEDVDCAVREFCEETGFEKEEIELQPGISPFEEIFYGTNHILYRHVYYLARITEAKAHQDLHVDPQNLNQAREVRDLQWFTYEDVLSHIRNHNSERKELFSQVYKKLLTALATSPRT